MKQTFAKAALLVSACLLGAMSLPANAEALEKYRVAITDLVLSPSLSASAAKTVSQSSLRSDMEAGVRNSRKFDVVSRNTATLNAIRAEQQFAKSGLAAGDAAQEGQLSNAQSIVQVEVQNFSFGRSAKKVPNIDNKYRVSDYASIELGVTIVDTTTGKITGAFNVKGNASSPTVVANSVGSASRTILNKALDRAVGSFVDQLTDTIFPIMVIQAKGKRLYVNRGNDGGMKVGDTFIVFLPGEDLIDPVTGENLGSEEKEIGTAKVTRVNPKFTIVEMTKGDTALVQPGCILRRPVK